MKLTNKTLLSKSEMVEKVRKADVNVRLVTDQAEAFIFDILQNSETLKKLTPVFKDQTSGNIEAIEAQTRKTRKATDVNVKASDGNFNVNYREIPYNVEKIFLDAWIKNDDVWYALRQRGQNLETALISMMQEAFALDMQDLLFNGDKSDSGADKDFLNIIDGFIVKIKAIDRKATLTALPSAVDLLKLKKKIPSKYFKNPNFNFRWIISENTKTDLIIDILSRPTAWADTVIVNGEITKLVGFPIEIVSTYPDNFIALTPLENLQPVFTREVRYNMTGVGVEAVRRDSTYHINWAYLDAIINNPECVAWMTYTEAGA